ncbi:MAG: hypothetical protein JJ975_09790 [Bacteroidia bacterium]|nr:hypothetical protein [Bacteroidia bacterium]
MRKMTNDKSGSIFKFQLEHDKGYAYAEILAYPDCGDNEFMARVFTLIDFELDTKRSIEEITQSGVYLGPLVINKFPSVKGKTPWNYIGRNPDSDFELTPVKNHNMMRLHDDWSLLGPWQLFRGYGFDVSHELLDYEDVRHYETDILTHKDAVPTKVTMRQIIDKGERLSEYYDFDELGNRNLLVQVVNTYYPKQVAQGVLSEVLKAR